MNSQKSQARLKLSQSTTGSKSTKLSQSATSVRINQSATFNQYQLLVNRPSWFGFRPRDRFPQIVHLVWNTCKFSKDQPRLKITPRLQVDGFVVKQQFDTLEMLTGIERENTYNVLNKAGQQVKSVKIKNPKG